MRPLTVLTGIVLGSAFSIAFGLAVVWLIFQLIGADEPLIAAETGAIGPAIAVFSLLTAVAAVSFVARLKNWRFAWAWQLLMWGSLAAVVVYWRAGVVA